MVKDDLNRLGVTDVSRFKHSDAWHHIRTQVLLRWSCHLHLWRVQNVDWVLCVLELLNGGYGLLVLELLLLVLFTLLDLFLIDNKSSSAFHPRETVQRVGGLPLLEGGMLLLESELVVYQVLILLQLQRQLRPFSLGSLKLLLGLLSRADCTSIDYIVEG